MRLPEPRDRVVRVYVSERELALIEKEANEQGMASSQWARTTLMLLLDDDAFEAALINE